MPEIKNTFDQGVMNQDLDERIVPNGQYIEAMNIKVTSSDDASVGVVQNILGNKRVETEVSPGHTCIATIADEKNNKVYWFVTKDSDSTHAILQYDLDLELTKFVLVDKHNDTLKFTQNIITGINIIDDLLFWTDNYSEPKKINIKDCILGTEQDGLTHTKLFVNGVDKGDISEKHITVIKQSPKHFPSTSINEPADENTSKLFEQVFPRFSLRYRYKDGEYSSFGPFTQVVFNPKYVGETTKDNAYAPEEAYNLAMINNVESIEISNFINEGTPKDVDQIEILYKEDGSSVVFSIKKINYSDIEWTNNTFTLKSESIFAAIPENQSLRVWDNVPRKALAQEITGNRLVYGNYTQGHNLFAFGNNTQVTNKLESSFELRNNANTFNSGGLPSLKTQRNYQVGFVWGDKYGRETPVFTSDDGGVNIPWYDNNLEQLASKSLILKTNLSTNIPSWADYYKIYVKETSGEYYNLVMEKAYAQIGFSAFDEQEDRIWLAFSSADRNKVTEDDYLILKKEIGGNDEQVKLENKFKILDIQNEAPDAIRFEYKSLGEATQTDDANTNNPADYLTNTLFPSTGTNRIDHTTDMVHVKKGDWLDVTGGGSLTPDNDNDNLWNDNIYISWVNTSENQHSEKYRVISVNALGTPAYYRLKLDRPIEEEDAKLADANDVANEPTTGLKENLKFIAELKTEKDLDEYSGKFFVQIFYKPPTNLTTENILNGPFQITGSKKLHLFYDPTTTDSIDANGNININVDLGTTGVPTDTAKTITLSQLTGSTTKSSAWVELAEQLRNSDEYNSPRGFFIDHMCMVAGQPFNDNTRSTSVKLSGKTWVGWGETNPNQVSWGITNVTANLSTGQINEEYGWKDPTVPTSIISSLPSSYSPRPFSSHGSADVKDVTKAMNGLEGFLTTKSEHVGNTVETFTTSYGPVIGFRRWKDKGGGANPLQAVGDDTYGDIPATGDLDQDERFFVHLSFLAPGKDLHNGIWPTDFHNFAELKGANSPGAHMQGIWGGGIFTANGLILEMEGNYQPNLTANANAPRPGVGYGYDTNYATDNDRQWDPSYGGTDEENAETAKFLENLRKGSVFRFPTTNGKFKELKIISDVKEKRLYNHTPWIAQYKWDEVTQNPTVDNEGLVLCGNSVDEAAETFLNDTADAGNFSLLLDKITLFGKAHNRRVVYIFEVDKNPLDYGDPSIFADNFTELDSNTALNIDFVSNDTNVLLRDVIDKPAIWETEAKAGEELDIYYEASQAIPLYLNNETNELFAPIGSRVEILNLPEARNGKFTIDEDIYVKSWNGRQLTLTNDGFNRRDAAGNDINYDSAQIRFFRPDGSYTTTQIITPLLTKPDTVDFFDIDPTLDPAMEQGAAYFNCFSFGNGIESNRVRDDFNAPSISKGVKASLVLEQDYKEEHRKNGLIFSGIYNSTSGVNNLNQFIMAENITKDLNPTYGSIQKLFQRRISLVAFCEDKVVSIVSNKDALFNADGNVQLVSTNNVLGDATPFVGDYGISQNPESFAKESYRAYFTDKQRGAVLRLSMDGITPISQAGMDDYFRDNLVLAGEAIGTYDAHSKNYNLTLKYPKPSDNLVVNGSIDGGQDSQQAQPGFNVISNYNINSFTPVNLPTIDTTSNWFANPDINVETTITNYDEIGVGELIAETSTTTTTVNANTAFTADDSNASFYSGSYTDDTKDNPFHTGQFNFKLDVTSIYGGFQGQSSEQYPTVFIPAPLTPPHSSSSNNFWNASVSSGFFGPSGDLFWNPEIDSYTTSNNNSIAANPGGYDGGTASVDEPWFFKANANSTTGQNPNVGTGIVFDGSSGTNNIGNSLIVPGTPTYVSPQSVPAQVQTQYSGAEDNTIFNGEEVKLRFFFRNAVDSNFLGGNGPHNRKIQIQLYDGATALSDSILLDPSTTALTDTNYSTYQIASPNSGTYEVGYATTASYTFAEMIDDANHLHEIYFKFTDGTENEGIVVQDLQIHISMLGGSGHTGVCLGSMSSLNIRKVFELTSAEDITITTIPDNNPVPDAPIPAFATVQHLVQNHDLVEGGGTSLVEHTFVTRAKNTYGFNFQALDTITLTQSGTGATATYQFPSSGNVSNGTVFYDDGTGGTGMFADSTYNTDDIFTFDSARTEDTIVKQTGSVSLGFANWYFVDIRYNGTPSIPTTPITIQSVAPNGTLGSAHDTEFVTTTTDIYGTSEDVLRAIFQIDIPQSNDDKIKIRIPQDVDIEVESFHTQAINTIYSGGGISNWAFNNDPNPPQHSFDVPTLYGSSNGIEFDANIGAQRHVSQDIGDLPNTHDGYRLNFKVSNYVSGFLHVYAVNATNGIVFKKSQAEINQNGDYYVDFNFDGGVYDLYFDDGSGPVSIGTSDFARNPDGTVNSTSVTEKVMFLSNSNHGFDGCVTDITLADQTIIFSGGSIDNFTFFGFDPRYDNFISFEEHPVGSGDGRILFTDAPLGVRIQQLIQANVKADDTYRLKFNYDIAPGGSIGVYYYGINDKGFKVENLTGSGTYNVLHTMNEDLASPDLSETLVFFVENDDTNGTIDNIVLRREYLITDDFPSTISYSEKVRGWVSFKSFIPEQGVSLAGEYFTVKDGGLYLHNDDNEPRNTFYGEHTNSSVTTLLNSAPSSIKIFNTLNYEGTQSNVKQYVIENHDGVDYSTLSTYNLKEEKGWSVEYIKTDKQEGTLDEFIEKEGKWFNYIKGLNSTAETSDLSFQGLGIIKKIDTIL